MSSEARTVADRYLLEEKLGRGGMATVWRAKDGVLARTVAVKILHPGLADDTEFVERFRTEALAAARLSHSNIVAIYDTGLDEAGEMAPCHYIVLEHCGSGTLARLAAAEKVLDASRAAAIGATICGALDFAHRNGIVHRDIKPQNVLIADAGTLKVGDFGIAKAAALSGNITTTGAIIGTVSYISPEQASGQEPDARSDLYSLGVLLYELVVGRLPFDGASHVATAMKHLREDPPPPRSIRSGVPRPLESVILTALRKEPGDRFGSAAEMRAALERAGARDDAPTVAAPAAAPTPSPARPARPASTTSTFRAESSWIVPVLVLIAVTVVLAIALPRVIDIPSDTGDNGPGGGAGSERVEVRGVDDYDPHGDDGAEHPEDAHLAADGDPGTSWGSQTYNDPFELIGKPGVGLVFDLGDNSELARVEIASPDSGFDIELRAGDEVPGDETGFELIAEGTVEGGSLTLDLDEGETHRYWLVWVTSLPGGSGRVSIAEVGFVGR